MARNVKAKIERAPNAPLSAHVQADTFPKQGSWLNQMVLVKFHGDPQTRRSGVVVREDLDFPGITLIRLEDGRVVLGSEVRYVPKAVAPELARERRAVRKKARSENSDPNFTHSPPSVGRHRNRVRHNNRDDAARG